MACPVRPVLSLVGLLSIATAAIASEPNPAHPEAPPASVAAAAEAFPAELVEARRLAAERSPLAGAAFQRAARAHPRDPRVHREHGRWLLGAGKADDAVKAHETAVSLAPRDGGLLAELGLAYGRQAQQANPLRAMGLARKCRETLEKAVELAPRDVGVRTGLMMFYANAPGLVGGGMDKARAQAAAIAAFDPVEGALADARLAQVAKDTEAALAAIRRASALAPDRKDLLVQSAVLLQDAGKFDDAFATLDAALARDPSLPEAHYQLGRAAALSGRELERGEAALRHYLGLPADASRPGPAPTWWRIGQILRHRGDLAGARAAFEEALKVDPGFEQARQELGKGAG